MSQSFVYRGPGCPTTYYSRPADQTGPKQSLSSFQDSYSSYLHTVTTHDSHVITNHSLVDKETSNRKLPDKLLTMGKGGRRRTGPLPSPRVTTQQSLLRQIVPKHPPVLPPIAIPPPNNTRTRSVSVQTDWVLDTSHTWVFVAARHLVGEAVSVGEVIGQHNVRESSSYLSRMGNDTDGTVFEMAVKFENTEPNETRIFDQKETGGAEIDTNDIQKICLNNVNMESEEIIDDFEEESFSCARLDTANNSKSLLTIQELDTFENVAAHHDKDVNLGYVVGDIKMTEDANIITLHPNGAPVTVGLDAEIEKFEKLKLISRRIVAGELSLSSASSFTGLGVGVLRCWLEAIQTVLEVDV